MPERQVEVLEHDLQSEQPGLEHLSDSSRSSCPVSSPSSTTILIASVIGASTMVKAYAGSSTAAFARERADHRLDVLAEIDPELVGALAHLIASNGGRKARLLHLLLDRLGGHAAQALGTHVGDREDEAGELVDGVQRLLHRRLSWDSEVVGV